jgi:hypothetical protein
MRVYCLVIFASVLFYALTVTGLCDRILATQKGAAIKSYLQSDDYTSADLPAINKCFT